VNTTHSNAREVRIEKEERKEREVENEEKGLYIQLWSRENMVLVIALKK
jgi:hypothetical protein